jgi:hypothetical protein
MFRRGMDEPLRFNATQNNKLCVLVEDLQREVIPLLEAGDSAKALKTLRRLCGSDIPTLTFLRIA